MMKKIFVLALSILFLASCSSEAALTSSDDASSGDVSITISEDTPVSNEGSNDEENTDTTASSSSTSSDKNSTILFAMDTVMEISIYGEEELLSEATEIVYSLENKLSVTEEDSEIYAINLNGSGTLTGEAAEVLACALEMCSRTSGALDISVYPVVREWGFTTGDYKVPSDETLSELLALVDYEKIQFDGSLVTLGDGMEIDLGSITKGYLSQLLVDYFKSNGVESALINLGGNVQTLGTKPDGSKWKIAIQDPEGNGNAVILSVADKAVITSGGYERYFIDDGIRYCHIIDPSTGMPSDNGLISVSIIGDSGVTCDGLSTALFVMGLEDAIEFWKSSDDFEAILITEDGDIYITEGLADSYTLVDSYLNSEVTIVTRD